MEFGNKSQKHGLKCSILVLSKLLSWQLTYMSDEDSCFGKLELNPTLWDSDQCAQAALMSGGVLYFSEVRTVVIDICVYETRKDS